jgi:hypothetical protein
MKFAEIIDGERAKILFNWPKSLRMDKKNKAFPIKLLGVLSV